MKYHTLAIVVALIFCSSCKQLKTSGSANGTFTVYADSVVQGNFKAVATSDHEITSNYQSPANSFQSPRVDFKFSINSKDNEMVSGVDHHINCLSEKCETPLIVFGKQFNDTTTIPPDTYLKANTHLNIKLDMREVFNAFEAKGFFQTFNGEKIYKEDFKGVYVAGGKTPLTWDFDNLGSHKDLELKDNDGDHIYEITLIFNQHDDQKTALGRWKLKADVSAFPQYTSSSTLQNAVYNLSLEEMMRAVEADSTFRTGKEWAGVWTRDISYSIILSMAVVQPKVAKYSLMRKVKDGVIIQDTGTGGAYPVSTDRIIWAVAARELYKVTGDQQWLKDSYAIIKKSIEQDLHNAMDPTTGLIKGESSFLDWREQTYPDWMQPADIYESQCLGTNVVHFQANRVLAEMASLVGDEETASKHNSIAIKIQHGINEHLWLTDKGYYGQYRYGRNFKTLSPRSEALGEALAVLFDVAGETRVQSIIANTPTTTFGIPCLYPQIPNIPPYHNNATWPFVQAYWTMACAKGGNENAVAASMNNIIRPTAFFLTNKENFVSENGDFVGTQVNSDNMLWSLSGNIALVYKVLFGMKYEADRISFNPFVPAVFDGDRSLKNFRYRNAGFDISLRGHGSKIKSFKFDGKVTDPFVLASVRGKHTIEIELDGNALDGKVAILKHSVAPETPKVTLADNVIRWKAVPNVDHYKVMKNGKVLSTVMSTHCKMPDEIFGEYQVIAVTADSVESFASEPVVSAKYVDVFEMESFASKSTKLNAQGFLGDGFVEVSTAMNKSILMTIDVERSGLYAIDFRYANGNGPVNTENKCAIRTLSVNDRPVGVFVFPQRGPGEWSDWGFSNCVLVPLDRGKQRLKVHYDAQNFNMNGDVNQAIIDQVRLQFVKAN